MTALATQEVTREPSERIEMLDLIRGFTLGGILFANILWFSGFLEIPSRYRSQMLTSPADEGVLFLIRLLVHAKFYHIFAFLFGIGFAIQLERNGRGISTVFSRRLLLLFGFGLLHSLIWWGDIVRYYALLGFTLLLFRHLSNRQLLYWIIGFSLLPVLSDHVQTHAQTLGLGHFDSYSFVHLRGRQWLEFFASASLADQFQLNLRQIGDHFLNNVANGRIFKILAMFLAGLIAGRMKIFHDPEAHAALIRRLLLPSFLVGMSGNLISVSLYYEKWGISLSTVALIRDWILLFSVPALSLFYLCCLLWLGLGERKHSALFCALKWLIPPGRMPLSNYVGQSIIAGLIFRPGLGGYYGQLGVAQCAALVLVIYAGQIVFSHFWLRHYRFGPLEWLWRSGTRMQMQKLRI